MFLKKNVISFSLWGDSPIYWIGALRNIELARTFYPGWICRYYVDGNASNRQLSSLSGDNVEAILKERKHDFDGLFWRFFAASDPDVNLVMFRDCDSRIGRREAAAVDAWLKSDKDFHIMRDHPWHTTAILGGMWGCRGGKLPNIDSLIATWTSFDHIGCDQEFLAQQIYPLIAEQALEHSEFDLAYGNPTSPFPSQRQDFEFVGEVFDENDRCNRGDRLIVAEALLKRADPEIDRRQAEAVGLRAEIDSMRASGSWPRTGPLRYLVQRMRSVISSRPQKPRSRH
jgi:hypothetical protein